MTLPPRLALEGYPQGNRKQHGNAGAHENLPATAGWGTLQVLVRRLRKGAAPYRPEFEVARRHVVSVYRPPLFHCPYSFGFPPLHSGR